jgi:predicted peptidase
MTNKCAIEKFEPASGGVEALQYVVDRVEGTTRRSLSPLILYLHGACGRGDPDAVMKWRLKSSSIAGTSIGMTESIREENHPITEPFVIVSPICPRALKTHPGKRIEWTTPAVDAAVMQLLDMLLADGSTQIDPDRVYLTGVSMGGLGSWMMGARHPDRFAAIVPMCGGGKPLYALKLTSVPFWFFHAENDNCIGVEETDALVDALQKAGNTHVRYTRYKDCQGKSSISAFLGHNCWDEAYSTPELWQWLFKQGRASLSDSDEQQQPNGTTTLA